MFSFCNGDQGIKPLVVLFLILSTLLTACSNRNADDRPSEKKRDFESNVVTTDIEREIKAHINEQVRLGKGYFELSFEEKDLRLKLVRIHVEYLATLGPTSHFACVDLASADGEFYDVDFFLAGDEHGMSVTKTMVHKLNGQPFYVWEQQPDKTWDTQSVDSASHQLLGTIEGKDEFEFYYKATLPEIAGTAEIWLPLPQSDKFQTVKLLSIEAPSEHKVLDEKTHGNKVIHMTLSPEDSGKDIKMIFDVTRLEKGAYADKTDTAIYLEPDRIVPDEEIFNKQALAIVKGKEGDLVKARAIYDHIIDKMRYMKFGEGWGKGDAVYACNSLYGNCTDFHSLFIALARAVNIPARFAIGAGLPSERDEGGVDGYHCWAEFYAEGKWWPVDISEADKYSALSIYFFGHHPANRFEFTKGRDLVVEPGPQSGPINFLAYPVLEINGEFTKTKNYFSFRRKSDS